MKEELQFKRRLSRQYFSENASPIPVRRTVIRGTQFKAEDLIPQHKRFSPCLKQAKDVDRSYPGVLLPDIKRK